MYVFFYKYTRSFNKQNVTFCIYKSDWRTTTTKTEEKTIQNSNKKEIHTYNTKTQKKVTLRFSVFFFFLFCFTDVWYKTRFLFKFFNSVFLSLVLLFILAFFRLCRLPEVNFVIVAIAVIVDALVFHFDFFSPFFAQISVYIYMRVQIYNVRVYKKQQIFWILYFILTDWMSRVSFIFSLLFHSIFLCTL